MQYDTSASRRYHAFSFTEPPMSVERSEKTEIRLLQDIVRLLRRIWGGISFLVGRNAQSSTLFFVNSKGEFLMDVTVHLNDTPLRAFLAEFDGPNKTGNLVPGIGPTSYTSSDPSVATVDPVTGNLVYLKQGQTTVTGLNSGNQLTNSGVLTIISGTAQSSDLQFIAQASTTTGAPVGKTAVQTAASLAAYNAALAAGQTKEQATAAGLAAIATAVAHGE